MEVGPGITFGGGIAIGDVVGSDPYWPYVTALLHGDGTNGAQNNTFLDSGPNAFTVPRVGTPTQGSVNPFMTNYSNYFDGTGDYLTVASNSALDLTGDFTIELWANFTALSSNRVLLERWSSGASGTWQLYWRSTGTSITWYVENSIIIQDADASRISIGAWNHIAVTRSGSTMRLFVNGTQVGSATNSTSLSNSQQLSVGRQLSTGTNEFAGFISNIRIVKGTALYTTSTYTVPSTPLQAIANTSLLTCQSNRFIDKSTNNFTVTPTGGVSVQSNGPFATLSPYSVTTNGGSAFFDGDGDYLNIAANNAFLFSSSNFTLEAWVYLVASGSVAGGRGIANTWQIGGAWQWVITSTNVMRFAYTYESTGVATRTYTGTTAINLNSWNHVAVVRNGNSLSFYINGVLDASGAFDISAYSTMYYYDGAAKNLRVGIGADLGGPWLGYISNFRIVKGTAVYTSNFTPPAQPLSSISDTSLLLLCTNGGIYDNAMQAEYVTLGNAQISTSVKKYGTGSLAFDGSGDSLVVPYITTNDYNLGAGDFTVEMWVNFTALSTNRVLAEQYSSNTGWQLYWRATGTSMAFLIGATIICQDPSTTNITTGVWNHVAVTRSSTTVRLFVNGALVATGSAGTNLIYTLPLCLGAQYSTSTNYLNGYIDEFRITRGIARYTNSFTPQPYAFPDQ